LRIFAHTFFFRNVGLSGGVPGIKIVGCQYNTEMAKITLADRLEKEVKVLARPFEIHWLQMISQQSICENIDLKTQMPKSIYNH
jgi:hypothetical protein